MTNLMDRPQSFRPSAGMLKKIDRAVELNPEKYSGRSHFVRCAIIRLLRNEPGVVEDGE